MSSPQPAQTAQYINPVYPFACPDPFVLKYLGEYWCYGTGFDLDGGCFPILHSTDLVHWKKMSSAMQPLPGGHTQYWAPEVAYFNGVFYLYYAVGDGTLMHLRVATSPTPQGPFTDSGRRLTQEEFAIDAHPFVDEDGSRYMFYATDFLNYERIGTGTVVDRLIDPFTLEGNPRPVNRAKYDWQVFDPARTEKGGVKWHTIEGSFVLKHKGKYYHMFSGGNWQNDTYGAAYSTSERILRDDEWEQAFDGSSSLPVLRTIQDQGVIGPGHNSVVRGPDNRQLFIVYHRWSREVNNRVVAIDRLGWEDDRLVVDGPTYGPQPIPKMADHTFQRLLLPATAGTAATADAPVGNILYCPPVFILEGSLRLTAAGPQAAASLTLAAEGLSDYDPRAMLTVTFAPGTATLSYGHERETIALPADLDLSVFHLLRLTVDKEGDGYHHQATLWLDGIRLGEPVELPAKPSYLLPASRSAITEWAAIQITSLE